MSNGVVPFSLKDAPALIERLLPVQKLSAEAYKEQMAVHGKTLTALGSYWKGRKPLILNKACILGCLLPATQNPVRDLEIYEMLMAMDDESFVARLKRRHRPKELLERLTIARITDYFTISPEGLLPVSAPVDWSNADFADVKVVWREDLPERERRRLEAQLLPQVPYRARVDQARRPEEVADTVHDHIWTEVNAHLGTSVQSFPELVEQLGLMRFGRRPRVADTFCGSGQIPFEAARLGCDVYASDLNPMACMLTWGAFHIVGGSEERRKNLALEQKALMDRVQAEIDALAVEVDGHGWQAKVFLYCVEVRCPQTGWLVPLLPTLLVSKGYRVVADLIADPLAKRYEIRIRSGATDAELTAAEVGTVRRDSRFGEANLVHEVDGVLHRTKVSTLRGDYERPDGTIANRLRLWGKADFIPHVDDLLQERLYCVEWMRPKRTGKGYEYEFRSVTAADMDREHVVEINVRDHLSDWQARGWVPDMRIEVGGPPRYQGQDLVRARGWTHWHHAFNARQLLVGAIVNRETSALGKFALTRMLNKNSRLSRWDLNVGGGGATQGAFDNQALNTLYNYGTRGIRNLDDSLTTEYKRFPLTSRHDVRSVPADAIRESIDIYVHYCPLN